MWKACVKHAVVGRHVILWTCSCHVHTVILALVGRGGEVLGTCIPTVCCMVNGRLQKSKFAEEFHSCLSTQALCPQIGHMLVGVCTPVCLGHLSKGKDMEKPSVCFTFSRLSRPQVLPASRREPQNQLLPPNKPFQAPLHP